ncbi:hypothetical protein BGZ47_002728 [Haplosporangium gracile]|nr:hypothetical protein BGZ47_002728 [Haplosporangium gracile]
MSATEQNNALAPLDPFGNEICLLFLKYGKCRYKKKCKKSHIVPDKNAPIMQQMTPVVSEKPVVKEGPKIAFTVKKTPYSRPLTALTSASSSAAPNLKRIPHQKQQGPLQDLQRQELPKQQRNSTELGSVPLTQHVGQDVVEQTLKSKDGATKAMDVDLQPSTTLSQEEPKKPRKPKAKRPPKVHVHRLLSSLFKTTISSDVITASRSTPSTTTGYPGPSVKGRKIRDNTTANRKQGHQGSRKLPFATTGAHGTTVSSNELEAADEKIENWYTTYKAHLEPKTRRLMVMTKPTTARHQSQLKAMRKHHWECQIEIEQQLKRHVPTAFSLKIVRTRIHWERVAPYITLMIQAVSARIFTMFFWHPFATLHKKDWTNKF